MLIIMIPTYPLHIPTIQQPESGLKNIFRRTRIGSKAIQASVEWTGFVKILGGSLDIPSSDVADLRVLTPRFLKMFTTKSTQ